MRRRACEFVSLQSRQGVQVGEWVSQVLKLLLRLR